MPSSNPDIAVFEAVAQQDASLRWYAIADSAQHRALPSAVVQSGHQVRCLFGASQGSPLAQHSPHLVELCSPLQGSSAWNWISLSAKSKPCLTVIATGICFDALFTQLAECAEVVLPDGDAMFLGFWDPAILGTLVGQAEDSTLHVKGPVLTSEQRPMLTRGLAAWWYWDRAGGLHSIAVDQVGNEWRTGPIQLAQWQVDDLVEASVPDHVLYYLELNQPLLIADVPAAHRYEAVHLALVRARGLGLRAMGDLVNFACLELIYKERMREDSFILNLLDRVKQGRLKFRDALDQLP
jgi:hypothetical protein